MLEQTFPRVREANLGDEAAWNGFVDRDPDRPPFATFAWQRILQESYGAKSQFLIAEDARGIRGVLPLYASPSGRQLFGLRFGLCTADASAEAALLQAATVRSHRSNVQLCSGYQPLAAAHAGWTPRNSTTLLLDLAHGEEAAWSALRDKTRNAVRKGMRAGVRADWGSQGLEAFHAIYLDRMAGKGTGAHSLAFFRSMFAHLADRVMLLSAVAQGRVIGGTIVLRSRNSFCSTFQAATDGANTEYAATSFMEWEVARGAIAVGAGLLDMGESTPGSGTYAFKANFGGRPAAVHYYRLGRGAGGGTRPSAGGGVRATILRLVSRAPLAAQRRVALWRGGRGRII